eukprot:1851515-Amphidinium_carterae.2
MSFWLRQLSWDSCELQFTLSKPAKPAAPSKWPWFDFPAQSNIWGARVDCPPRTALRAFTSIGSPKAVPVPWHSTAATASQSNRGRMRDFRG